MQISLHYLYSNLPLPGQRGNVLTRSLVLERRLPPHFPAGSEARGHAEEAAFFLEKCGESGSGISSTGGKEEGGI